MDITCRCSVGVRRQRIFRPRARMRPHDRGHLETRRLHGDVERSSAKSLGVGRLQGNLSSPRYLEAFPPPGHHEPVKFTVPTYNYSRPRNHPLMLSRSRRAGSTSCTRPGVKKQTSLPPTGSISTARSSVSCNRSKPPSGGSQSAFKYSTSDTWRSVVPNG